MELPENVDVLIVGAGPVGVTLGNLLGRYGIRTLIIDREKDILTHPRAIALDNEALRVLQMAGLSELAFLRVAIPAVRMHSPYVGEFARINTAGCLDGHPKLVTFFQPELEQALRSALQAYPQVRLALETEMLSFGEHDDHVTADLKCRDGSRRTVSARYLVGADGAGSRVRELLGLSFEGATYAEDWLIVDARYPRQPIDHIEFVCDPKRPTPHMPAPGGRERWEFMMHPGETREQMLSPAKIRELLEPWADSSKISIERSAVYRFHARVVTSFQKGRAFLVGDAAHIIPPFLGQGLCAGMRDAANLGWKLAWVLEGRAAPAILDSYDVERRPHTAAMIRFARLMRRLVMPTSAPTAVMVHGLVSLMHRCPLTRPWIEDFKIKPQNRFDKGLFLRGKGPTGLVSGSHFPQALLQDADGRYEWSDEALKDRLTLVGFGIDPHAQLDPAGLSAWETAGGHCLQICYRGQVANRITADYVWEDPGGDLLPNVVPVGWLAVVRPDRTLICDGPATDANTLIRETLRLLSHAGEAHGSRESVSA